MSPPDEESAEKEEQVHLHFRQGIVMGLLEKAKEIAIAEGAVVEAAAPAHQEEGEAPLNRGE